MAEDQRRQQGRKSAPRSTPRPAGAKPRRGPTQVTYAGGKGRATGQTPRGKGPRGTYAAGQGRSTGLKPRQGRPQDEARPRRSAPAGERKQDGFNPKPRERYGRDPQRERTSRPPREQRSALPREQRNAPARQQRQPITEVMQSYIDQLLTARGEERRKIVQQMAKHGRSAISAVDRLLTSRDAHLRLAAAMVLSNIKSPQVIPALAHAMQDADAAVRLQAAAGLGEHKRPGAREALWYAFPDKTPGVSVAILRSMDKIMTRDMEDALQAMDKSKLSPRVRSELEQILIRRAKGRDQTADFTDDRPEKRVTQSPLYSAPWLRLLPAGRCTGVAVVGTEEIAATLLRWKFPDVDIIETPKGQVQFQASANALSHLVEARALESVWVELPRNKEMTLTDDTKLFDTLYAFSHAKGLQSLIASGDIGGVAARSLGQALSLRSARPPGNPRTLRLHVSEQTVVVEFISPTDFPMYRPTTEGAATLRTLAACVCALTVNSQRDVFLDPFCGDGAVVVERALLGPLKQAVAVDEEEHLANARRTWKVMAPLTTYPREVIRFLSQHGTRLPLGDESVDAIASILTADQLDALDIEALQELARVLRPSRRAVFLMPESNRLEQLASAAGLNVQQAIPVGEPQVGKLVVLAKPE